MNALQSRGILPGVHPSLVGTQLESGDGLEQKIEQHHHQRKPVLC
jgi:hypothetical protein